MSGSNMLQARCRLAHAAAAAAIQLLSANDILSFHFVPCDSAHHTTNYQRISSSKSSSAEHVERTCAS